MYRSISNRDSSAGKWRFGLRSLLLAVAVVSLLLVPMVLVVKSYRSLRTQTISIRLDSSGRVEWDGRRITVRMLPYLREAERQLRSHGFRSHLMIESYSDVGTVEIARLAKTGQDAGFGLVETRRLAWPSPYERER